MRVIFVSVNIVFMIVICVGVICRVYVVVVIG